MRDFFRFMKLILLQKIIVFIDILILASLPFIAAQGSFRVSTTETQTPLSEASLSPEAKFKAYDDALAKAITDTSYHEVKQEERSKVAAVQEPKAQRVLVAGESIGIAKIEPTTAPEPTVAQNPIPTSLSQEAITFLGNCESGMTATRNSGNGYYGAFQFSISTWNSMNTGYERADLAPLEVQIEAVQRLIARSSIYGQFPACAQKMKSLGLI